MQRFAKEGFPLINSFVPDTYVDFYVKDERMFAWHPQSNFRFPKALWPQVIGGEACAWAESGFEPYVRTLPSTLTLFGDRVWNRRPVTDPDAFAEMTVPHLFGPHAPAEWRRLYHAQGQLVQIPKERFNAAPTVLRSIPPEERRALCARLARSLSRGRRDPRIRNARVLEHYIGVLKEGLGWRG